MYSNVKLILDLKKKISNNTQNQKVDFMENNMNKIQIDWIQKYKKGF